MAGCAVPNSPALGPGSARTRRARLPALTRRPARGPHRRMLPGPAAAADQGRARSRHRRPHPSRAPPPQLRTRARSSAPGPALLCPRGAPPGVRRSAGSRLRALDRGGPCLTPAPPATALVARPRGAGRPRAPGRTPLRDAAPRHGSKGKNSRVTGFPTRPAPPAPQDPSRARASENAPPGPGSHLSRRSPRPPGLALHSLSAARRATVSADPAPKSAPPLAPPFSRPNFDRASHPDPAPSALRPAFALAPPPPSTFSVPRLRRSPLLFPTAHLAPPVSPVLRPWLCPRSTLCSASPTSPPSPRLRLCLLPVFALPIAPLHTPTPPSSRPLPALSPPHPTAPPLSPPFTPPPRYLPAHPTSTSAPIPAPRSDSAPEVPPLRGETREHQSGSGPRLFLSPPA